MIETKAAAAAPLRLLQDFESAGRPVLAHLHRQFGFGLWMLTRTEGEAWMYTPTRAAAG